MGKVRGAQVDRPSPREHIVEAQFDPAAGELVLIPLYLDQARLEWLRARNDDVQLALLALIDDGMQLGTVRLAQRSPRRVLDPARGHEAREDLPFRRKAGILSSCVAAARRGVHAAADGLRLWVAHPDRAGRRGERPGTQAAASPAVRTRD
jgi:hypothetical protein